jgi:MbtH protein
MTERTNILDRDDALFHVVVNHEEQYSIWPADREPPAGWERVGEPALRPACLAKVNELWTDMRPKSLRDWATALARDAKCHNDQA